jgi:hypothetical protein
MRQRSDHGAQPAPPLHHLQGPRRPVTLSYGINDYGQIVGFSAASLTATAVSGFLRDARGRFTAINRPGATVTVPFDIDNRGQIVGVAGARTLAPTRATWGSHSVSRM